MNLSIFATSNEVERLSAPLRSRFMELHLGEYTYQEFTEVIRRLLKKRYRLDSTISEKISYEVWYTMKSTDVRDAIRIAKLTKSPDDVYWLVNVHLKYGIRRA